MINADNVDAELAHQGEIPVELFGRPEIVAFGVRFEWAVGDAFNEELAVPFEEELRDGANRAERRGTHSGVP
jgi:hypothetical protein